MMATSSASLDRSPKSNWVEEAGGLPPYIRKIARAIERTGRPLDVAIPIAISRIKVWAAGGDGVTAKTQAKAAAAYAQWLALRAKAGAKMSLSHTLEEVSEETRNEINAAWATQPMGPRSTIVDYQDGEILVEYEGATLMTVNYFTDGGRMQFGWPLPVEDVPADEDLEESLTTELLAVLLDEQRLLEDDPEDTDPEDPTSDEQ